MLNNDQKTVDHPEARNFTFRDLLAKTISGKWIKIAILLFVIELVFLFLASTIPIPQSLVDQIKNQNNQLFQQAQSLSLVQAIFFIFANNVKIALLEFVPVVGWFFFGISMLDTGLAIEVIGMTTGNLPGPVIAFTLLLEPHTWLELPAYAIATTQSFFLVSTAAQRYRFKFEAARTGLVIGIVVAELAIAAIFESSELSLAHYGAFAVLAVPWICFAALAIFLALERRRFLNKYKLEHPPPSYMPSASTYLQQPYQTAGYASFCGKCGAKVNDPQRAVYCNKCGQRLIQPLASTSPANPSSEPVTNLPPPPNP